MKNTERTEHPTQKPVDLIALLLKGYCKPKGIVYDPTLGSGTTVIAAEMTGHTCHGIEKDPRYMDMILQRWHTYTGNKPKKL